MSGNFSVHALKRDNEPVTQHQFRTVRIIPGPVNTRLLLSICIWVPSTDSLHLKSRLHKRVTLDEVVREIPLHAGSSLSLCCASGDDSSSESMSIWQGVKGVKK